MTSPLFGQPAKSAAPNETAPAAVPARLGSSVFRWEDLVVTRTPTGERRAVHNGPTTTFQNFSYHATTLLPGNISHPPHRHAQEEFIILKEGTLDVHINGREERVGAGALLFFAANDWHAVKNVGDVPATYLVFNVRTAATGSGPEQGAEKAAVPGKMTSRVWIWEKLEAQPTRVGERRPFFDTATTTFARFTVHATTLNGGLISHAAHRHPDEEIIVVKEGAIEATIEGRQHVVGAGGVFFFASQDEHGLRNAADTRATYYVIRIVTEQTPLAPR